MRCGFGILLRSGIALVFVASGFATLSASLVPEGDRTITIKIGEESARQSFCRPNACVNVVTTSSTTGKSHQTVTQLFVTNARVLAVGMRDGAFNATLLVTPQEAEKLVLNAYPKPLLCYQLLPAPAAILPRQPSLPQSNFCWKAAFEWRDDWLGIWTTIISQQAIKCPSPILDPLSLAHP